jgi:radical SAM protein with 4Fe4S-binding SPASM domain
MTTNTIYQLIDQFIDIGVMHVSLSGGEVTLRQDLAQIVRRLVQNDIAIFLATNALSLRDRMAQQLKEAGLTKVQAKLDAARPETQDSMAGIAGAQAKLINGIKALKKHSFYVSIAIVVTAENVWEVPDVIALCADLGVDEVTPRVFRPGIWALSGERAGSELNLSAAAITWLAEEIECLKDRYKDSMHIQPLDIEELQRKPENRVPTCPGLVSSCTILENGLVIPCEMFGDFSEDFIIGDVTTTLLIDIWRSEKARKWNLRQHLQSVQPCAICPELERCRGGCPYKSLVAYGRWLSDPSCVWAPAPTAIPLSEVS